jgi:hypothetical protein
MPSWRAAVALVVGVAIVGAGLVGYHRYGQTHEALTAPHVGRAPVAGSAPTAPVLVGPTPDAQDPEDDAGPTDTPAVLGDDPAFAALGQAATDASYGIAAPSTALATAAPAWQWGTTWGPIIGRAGTIRRYRITVEAGLPTTVNEFTKMVDATLKDSRSWTAGGTVRLERVPATSWHHFTIYLAKPWTAYQLCRSGGIDIRIGGVPYTSCRVGSMVVINSDRYFKGVPKYGASLTVYRQYVINHEVGHFLGHSHVHCPGAGRVAPVMEQQTLGLQGCKANGFPYVNGHYVD